VGFFYAGTVLCLIQLGIVMSLGLAFWFTLVIATLLWVWQYYRLCQKTIPHRTYAQLFRKNVAIGFVLLVGMILGTRG
ncbi:MAG TPA: 4-hydroxybenzoate octaprenyltransferase, partial [Thermosynechococcaceae cyanobacterium]